jgi:hypothetical protein
MNRDWRRSRRSPRISGHGGGIGEDEGVVGTMRAYGSTWTRIGGDLGDHRGSPEMAQGCGSLSVIKCENKSNFLFLVFPGTTSWLSVHVHSSIDFLRGRRSKREVILCFIPCKPVKKLDDLRKRVVMNE